MGTYLQFGKRFWASVGVLILQAVTASCVHQLTTSDYTLIKLIGQILEALLLLFFIQWAYYYHDALNPMRKAYIDVGSLLLKRPDRPRIPEELMEPPTPYDPDGKSSGSSVTTSGSNVSITAAQLSVRLSEVSSEDESEREGGGVRFVRTPDGQMRDLEFERRRQKHYDEARVLMEMRANRGRLLHEDEEEEGKEDPTQTPSSVAKPNSSPCGPESAVSASRTAEAALTSRTAGATNDDTDTTQQMAENSETDYEESSSNPVDLDSELIQKRKYPNGRDSDSEEEIKDIPDKEEEYKV